MKNSVFYRQADLLLRILPIINTEKDFALKGGTAINFFVRNMPRLSVDIDLTYLPITAREDALANISRALSQTSAIISKQLPGSQITQIRFSDFVRGLLVRRGEATIKIEPNIVMRGSIYAPQIRNVSKRVQEMFELDVSMSVLLEPELYAGKICAALDRQHPRDLFDVKILLDNGELDGQTRKAFLVYLICHPRPIAELLNPNLVDIKDAYEKDFKDMTFEKIEFGELLKTRNQLISLIMKSLSSEDKSFIISVKSGTPEWGLIKLEGIENLPAVKWKIFNIKKMAKAKHGKAIEKLRACLEI